MISNLSVVHKDAKIGKNVTIEPFAHIYGNVEIGDNTWIGSNAVVMDGTTVGSDCKVFPGAVLGAAPQDLKYAGEETYLVIGDRVMVRECCTLNKATTASNYTRIGNDTLLMAYVHVAHDCTVGNNCILANNVNLAGHVNIEDFVILGGMVPVHQFVTVGCHSMVGGGSLVRKDVPPYIKAAREPLSYVGINSIGLGRRGFEKEKINLINDIYRIIYVSGLNMTKAIVEVEANIKDCEEKDKVLTFIKNSQRGLIRGYNG